MEKFPLCQTYIRMCTLHISIPRHWQHPQRRILELKTTVGWRLVATRLDCRQILPIECNNIVIYLFLETTANVSIHQTTLDPTPILVIRQMILELVRVIPKFVLLIPSVRYHLTHALVGDHEHEYGEAQEPHNHKKITNRYIHNRKLTLHVDPTNSHNETINRNAPNTRSGVCRNFWQWVSPRK